MNLATCILLVTLTATALASSTLEKVRASKTLVCGINTEQPDYSRSDDHGPREAFDRDLCRAVAVAILGPDARIKLKPYPDDSTAMQALRTGTVDLLPSLTKDFTHTTATPIAFSAVVLWDGVGFLVPVASGVERPEQLAAQKVCLLDATEVQETVAAWFRRTGLSYDPFSYQEQGEMEAALVTGGCAAIAGDKTRLASTKIGFGPIAQKFRLLPDTIANDPLASAYLHENNNTFGQIVDWVIQVLLTAEELNITQSAANSPQTLLPAAEWDITLRRLTGKTHELGARLALPDNWAIKVIAAVGNYGEIYDRDLGPASPMALPRASNRLARDGGLMVALPVK